MRASRSGAALLLAVASIAGPVLGASPRARGDVGDSLVIVGGTVVDGTDRAPIPDAVVVVRDGRIVTVTSADARVPSPAGRRIDARGQWIMPGLIDAHVHYYTWMGEGFLRHGVTTVRDVGANLETILERRRQSRADDAKGPRLFTCGPLMDGPAPRHGAVISVSVTTEDEARRLARYLVSRGVDCLKIYEQLTPDLVRAIADEARRAGVPATAHLRDTPAVVALAAGVTGLEHAFGFDACDEPAGTEVARLVVERRAYVVPTLAVMSPTSPRLPCLQRFVGRLQKLGGRVVAGSDTANTRPLAGAMLHRELELLVAAGLSPREALRSATVNAAELLGQEANLGAVEAGKIADLVVVRGDPTASIAQARQVSVVIRDGRVVWTRP